jgi:hypothetical protein
MVEYAQDFEVEYHPVPRYGVLQLAPGQGASGYGGKISTDYMVRFANKKKGDRRNHLYRVYAACWSNVASFYVIRRSKKLCVRSVDLERVSAKLDGGG